jgi:hypothetical protein
MSFHAGIVRHPVQAHRQRPAGGLRRGIRQHVAGDVAAGIDVAGVERDAVRVLRRRGQAGRQDVAQVHAVQHGAGHRIRRRFLLEGQRRLLQVQRDGGGQHLDVADLLGAGVQQHVAVLHRAARAPALEHVLQADADLAFDAADRLLQGAGEDRVRTFDAHRILQLAVHVEHVSEPPWCVGPGAQRHHLADGSAPAVTRGIGRSRECEAVAASPRIRDGLAIASS